VFAANYNGGSVVSYKVRADRGLSEAVSFFQFAGSGSDSIPHAHRVTVSPDQRFLLVNDLGLDQIHIFELDVKTAKLTAHEPAKWKATPGTGPRALRFHPNERWAYCLTELKSTVNVLQWDGRKGSFERMQEISMLPDDYVGPTGAAEFVIDPNGRFAYASNRKNNFLATFTVSPADGRLTLVERSSCGGDEPRHITLDETGRWLLVANQHSDHITVFARDEKTGKLAAAGRDYPIVAPECLVWV
jgi:6-phosphogluconolactonase